MKARTASLAKKFTDIPNIGPAMKKDFEMLGFSKPSDLTGQDPLKLYEKIYKITGSRHDPCVLDTYIAAVDFMNGAPARYWWKYTAERKKRFPGI